MVPERAAAAAGDAFDLVQEGAVRSIKALGWNMATRAEELGLTRGSLIDVAYRIRENDHPDFGGLEIELQGMEHSEQ